MAEISLTKLKYQNYASNLYFNHKPKDFPMKPAHILDIQPTS